MTHEDSTLASRELTATMARGSLVTVRVRDSFATGYFIGLDGHDYLLACTADGDDKLDPPIMLVVNRRSCLVVRCHTENSFDDEPNYIQAWIENERDTFKRAVIPAQRSIPTDTTPDEKAQLVKK